MNRRGDLSVVVLAFALMLATPAMAQQDDATAGALENAKAPPRQYSPKEAFKVGYERMNQGDLDAAETLFRFGLEHEPGDARAWAYLSDILHRKNDAAGAASSLARAQAVAADDITRHFIRRIAFGQSPVPVDELPAVAGSLLSENVKAYIRSSDVLRSARNEFRFRVSQKRKLVSYTSGVDCGFRAHTLAFVMSPNSYTIETLEGELRSPLLFLSGNTESGGCFRKTWTVDAGTLNRLVVGGLQLGDSRQVQRKDCKGKKCKPGESFNVIMTTQSLVLAGDPANVEAGSAMSAKYTQNLGDGVFSQDRQCRFVGVKAGLDIGLDLAGKITEYECIRKEQYGGTERLYEEVVLYSDFLKTDLVAIGMAPGKWQVLKSASGSLGPQGGLMTAVVQSTGGASGYQSASELHTTIEMLLAAPGQP